MCYPPFKVLLWVTIAVLLNSSLTAAEFFHETALRELDQAILNNIENHQTPGGVLWVESKGRTYSKAYGEISLEEGEARLNLDIIYDLASLTKSFCTAPCVLKLFEDEKLKIDAPVSQYLPEFGAVAGDSISIRHLLTHTSGLRPGLSLATSWKGSEEAYKRACAQKQVSRAGDRFIYSDINFILLGILVEKVSGQDLATYFNVHFKSPMGLTDTYFNPPKSILHKVAPTQKFGEKLLRGLVHDPTAQRMNGIAGHAGLFSNVHDLAKLARMIINDGKHNGIQILQPRTVKLMKTPHTRGQLNSWRSLGWDVDTGYTRLRGKQFSRNGIGHTGFTGPSAWIDFESGSIVLFLCNRVYPNGSGNILNLREEIGTLAAQSLIKPENKNHGKPGKVRTGLEVLISQKFASLKGKKIGLITNHTGHDRFRKSTLEWLQNEEQIELVALFSPEHGFTGAYDSKVEDSTESQTQLPIFSLYGESRKPSARQLSGIDTLVFDIQDIGTRFYTYISTMGLAMEAAAENNIEFIVLDRPNPIGGRIVSGPILDGEPDFVGFHTIPIRHGMTVGELAKLFKVEKKQLAELDLRVISCDGWSRQMHWFETGIPWTNPSPNMRSSTQALLYPGVGLIEMADISVGRGTDTPFEVVGAPYINEIELARELNRLGIHGIVVEPISFTPNASKFKDQLCRGVRFILTDRDKAGVVEFGIGMAAILHRLYEHHFELDRVNRLLRSQKIVKAIRDGYLPHQLPELYQSELKAFSARRAEVLLYE